MSDVDNEISVILDKVKSPIITIPGISNVTAAVILGEIGDISKFSNASKLAPTPVLPLLSVNQETIYPQITK